MFEHLSRSWQLVKASATVLKQDRKLLLFPLISAMALLAVLASFALPVLGWAAFGGRYGREMGSSTLYVLGFLFYLSVYFVIFFFNAALVGAALLGGTFMGIAGLAQWLARTSDPQASARRIGLLTVFYGLGQIAGPLLVAALGRGRDFTLPVLLAAGALLISAALLEVSRRVERLG